MSRFFAKPGDSSSEDETSEEETESEEESSSEDEKPQKKTASKFQDEPVKSGPRKVISAKDKRFEEMKATVKTLKNAISINDWNAVVSDFQKVNQQLAKIKAIGEGVPTFYVRVIVQLEKAVETTLQDKDKVKKMSKTNAKSLNAMKQNIRKNNANFESEIAALGDAAEEVEEDKSEDESESSESSESESESESDSDSSDDDKKKKKKDDSSDSGSDDDDESDWGSDSSSSSSEDDAATKGLTGMSKWMKTGKADDDSDDEGFKEVKKKEVKQPRIKEEKEKVVVQKEEFVLSEENVSKKMEEIMAMRGKKGTSKRDQIIQLELLATAKIPPAMTAQVLVALISAQFDSSMTRGGVSHMPVSFETEENGVKVASRANCLWSKCMNNIRALLTVLKENPELTEESTGQADTNQIQPTNVIQPSDFDDDDEMPIQVSSNLVSFVERLDDELFLSLRLEDHHSASFPKRLLDIDLLLELALDVQAYYEGLNNTSVVGRLSMRRLEHLYYKPDSLVAAAAKMNPQKGDRAEKRQELIAELALNVYKYGDDSIKMRAMLCHIYYHALHGRFLQARDMLLMSHLQDSVHQANNVSIQILFNRVMAQLGLSAFRTGMILEAHQCFDELCQGNRLKELLAQGISMNRYNNERSPEQEKAEKRRQTPYHMHMNIDLIESCHLVGAILIEIPKMVANQFDTKRKVTSKALKRVFEASDRNPLAGPPENTPREIIFAGAKALERGNWRECEGYILGLPVWQHLGSEEVVAKVKAMLKTRIQEEALRTYLFAYSAYYDALSCDQLCEMFELSKPAVSTLISKMILSDDRDVAPLSASWDQPTGSLVMHKKERSRLHHLSLQLSDTLGKLVETNEKGWDAKYGGYDFFKGQNKQGWQGRGGPQGAGRGGNRDGNKDGNREDRRDGGGRGGGGWGKK